MAETGAGMAIKAGGAAGLAITAVGAAVIPGEGRSGDHRLGGAGPAIAVEAGASPAFTPEAGASQAATAGGGRNPGGRGAVLTH